MSDFRSFFLGLAALALVGCAAGPKYIANTKVIDTSENREILRVVEQYRVAMEKKDAAKLMLMASEAYWDDSGTASANDDYGYPELKGILTEKLGAASDIRYSVQYRKLRMKDNHAFVDVIINASFTVDDALGQPSRRDMSDRNQFVLRLEGDEWKFLSGM
jgi:hypothetical protein